MASLISVKLEGLQEDIRIANAARLLVQAKIFILILIKIYTLGTKLGQIKKISVFQVTGNGSENFM